GEGHPDTAQIHTNVAWSLDLQGKYDDALRTWSAAAASYEQARLWGTKGLEAALTAGNSPPPPFPLAPAPPRPPPAAPTPSGPRPRRRGDRAGRAAAHRRRARPRGPPARPGPGPRRAHRHAPGREGTLPGAREIPRGSQPPGERDPPPGARTGATVREPVRRP